MITFQSDGIGQQKMIRPAWDVAAWKLNGSYLSQALFRVIFGNAGHDSRRHWFSIGLSMGASPKCLVDVSKTTGNSCNSMLRINFGVLPMFSWKLPQHDSSVKRLFEAHCDLSPCCVQGLEVIPPSLAMAWFRSRWPEGHGNSMAWHGQRLGFLYLQSIFQYDNLWQPLTTGWCQTVCNVCFDEIWIL